MNDADYEELKETAWRRKLSPAEEAKLQEWLGQNPNQQADWEAELGLNQLLGQLPQVAVASNFTARVLQELDKDSASSARHQNSGAWFTRWFRRPAAGLAWAAVLMVTGWLGYHQFSKPSGVARADDLAVLVKTVGQEPALFEDFDAIYTLPQADDEELYAVLSVQP